MSDNKQLKLFISYSHLDEKHIEDFIKHLAPLKENGLIEDWYDRKILPGKNFQMEIDNNFEDADIICLMISKNFLSSEACKKEESDALKLMRKKAIIVIPIIISPCGWVDDQDLSNLLALPNDGKPILEYEIADTGWNCVYDGLKKAITQEKEIRDLKLTESFAKFLQNTELLAGAHSQKETVVLDDIFVYPELSKFDELREYEKKVSSERLVEYILDNDPKIVIAGENQSGKTTLCKKLFIELRKRNFIPVYIFDKTFRYDGIIENRINKAYKEQYKDVPIEKIDKKRIVPILDDFHFAKQKEKHIKALHVYSHQIIVVDDIFCLNVRDENLIRSFSHFKIKELNPLLRNELLQKWTHLTDKESTQKDDDNSLYRKIDEETELVNTTLGKVLGNGIMPSYPFFILSIISTYETFAKPLNQDITSQGYCYQALIYLYLKKQDVRNDDIETYINFLAEYSFFFYEQKKGEISEHEYDRFLKRYLDKYNLPINKDILIEKLLRSQMLSKDSFGNYSFSHRYLYYFFVAKYLADHIDSNKEEIDKIIGNLHKDENAYIAVFLSHHSRNEFVLEEILLNAYTLFDNYNPATLTQEELSFIDEQIENIVRATLPPTHHTPEKERRKRLKAQAIAEQDNKSESVDNRSDELKIELRRSIKTVEVMGAIIKNRAGSLDKIKLEEIFKEAMNVHLRILTSFFELIKQEEEQEEIINFISTRLKLFFEKKAEERRKEGKRERTLCTEEWKKIAKTVFWNMNFFVIYGLLNKIVYSVGSDKLIQIIEGVCTEVDTPASLTIKNGILMWYSKNMQIENIENLFKRKDFSDTAKKIMRFLIVNHCSLHKINYKDRQRITRIFGIPSQRLLTQNVEKQKGNT